MKGFKATLVPITRASSMIERHYGALLDGAHAGIAGRLDALEAELQRAAKEAVSDVWRCGETRTQEPLNP